MRRGRLLLTAGAAVAAAVAIAIVLAFAGSSQGEEDPLLPDLDQAEPGQLSGRTVTVRGVPRFFLGFDSAAGNIGDGPLAIVGSRESTQQAEMDVVQRIVREDGSTRDVPVDAKLRYVTSSDHAHWHMLDFMTYELRRADGTLVAPDRKTGFCLGDRYELRLPLGAAEPDPLFVQECGKGQRGLLTLGEGISVGWGDDYDAHLEGQNFDITGLPAGEYLLVHRVNEKRVLQETDYSNNASSMAFRLSWPEGMNRPPRVDVINRCRDSDTCS
jgi:hypothetical protein